jgi:divalent metal cation (Fe/Co/Zn/Cd) transporter
VALLADAVALVAALVSEVAAADALAAASLAFVVAMTACSVTSRSVASVLESPAPPAPLYIAINNSYENKRIKERGTPKNPPNTAVYLIAKVKPASGRMT